MANENRPSLKTDLMSRYATQKSGGAFDVKKVLKNPGNVVQSGETINATSANGQAFQSPNGFEVKTQIGVTQFKDVQGGVSKQLSMYSKALDNRRYK